MRLQVSVRMRRRVKWALVTGALTAGAAAGFGYRSWALVGLGAMGTAIGFVRG
jgi:hypothetical protein